jgi:hypothetical protein
MTYILQINFEFQAPPEQLKQSALALANAIAQVPGLISKTWLLDDSKRQAGGIYWFETEAAAIAYLNGEIGQHIQQNPAFTNLQIRLTPVWQEATAITSRPLALGSRP